MPGRRRDQNGATTEGIAPVLPEVVRLLQQVSHCLSQVAPVGGGEADAARKLKVAREWTRICARLTAVVAWLLKEGAETAAPIRTSSGRRAGRGLFGLGDPRFTEQASVDDDELPLMQRVLLRQSAQIFSRVARQERERCAAGRPRRACH